MAPCQAEGPARTRTSRVRRQPRFEPRERRLARLIDDPGDRIHASLVGVRGSCQGTEAPPPVPRTGSGEPYLGAGNAEALEKAERRVQRSLLHQPVDDVAEEEERNAEEDEDKREHVVSNHALGDAKRVHIARWAERGE